MKQKGYQLDYKKVHNTFGHAHENQYGFEVGDMVTDIFKSAFVRDSTSRHRYSYTSSETGLACGNNYLLLLPSSLTVKLKGVKTDRTEVELGTVTGDCMWIQIPVPATIDNVRYTEYCICIESSTRLLFAHCFLGGDTPFFVDTESNTIIEKPANDIAVLQISGSVDPVWSDSEMLDWLKNNDLSYSKNDGEPYIFSATVPSKAQVWLTDHDCSLALVVLKDHRTVKKHKYIYKKYGKKEGNQRYGILRTISFYYFEINDSKNGITTRDYWVPTLIMSPGQNNEYTYTLPTDIAEEWGTKVFTDSNSKIYTCKIEQNVNYTYYLLRHSKASDGSDTYCAFCLTAVPNSVFNKTDTRRSSQKQFIINGTNSYFKDFISQDPSAYQNTTIKMTHAPNIANN